MLCFCNFVITEVVQVHKAVLLPLCPLLVSAALAVAPEEPTIILPDVSTEVVYAFLHIIYEGYLLLSGPSWASELYAVRDLMESFGLFIPAHRWTWDWLPPGPQQAGQERPESDQRQRGEVEGTDVENAKTPGASKQLPLQSDEINEVVGSGSPGSTREISGGKTSPSADSAISCLVSQEKASLGPSSFTEKEEEEPADRNQGQNKAGEQEEDSSGKTEDPGQNKDQVMADLELSDDESVEDQEVQSKQDQSRTKESVRINDNDQVVKSSCKNGLQSSQDPKLLAGDVDEKLEEDLSKGQNRIKELPETSSEDDDKIKNDEDYEKAGRDQMIFPIRNVEVLLTKLEDLRPEQEEPLDISFKSSIDQNEEIQVAGEAVSKRRKRKKSRSATSPQVNDSTDVDDEGKERQRRKEEDIEENLENDQEEEKYPVTQIGAKKDENLDGKKVVEGPNGVFKKFFKIAETMKVKKNPQKSKKKDQKTSVPSENKFSRNLNEQWRSVEKSMMENKNKKYLGFGETMSEEHSRGRKKVRTLKKAAKTLTEEEKTLMAELSNYATSESANSPESDI